MNMVPAGKWNTPTTTQWRKKWYGCHVLQNPMHTPLSQYNKKTNNKIIK